MTPTPPRKKKSAPPGSVRPSWGSKSRKKGSGSQERTWRNYPDEGRSHETDYSLSFPPRGHQTIEDIRQRIERAGKMAVEKGHDDRKHYLELQLTREQRKGEPGSVNLLRQTRHAYTQELWKRIMRAIPKLIEVRKKWREQKEKKAKNNSVTKLLARDIEGRENEINTMLVHINEFRSHYKLPDFTMEDVYARYSKLTKKKKKDA